MRIPIDPAKDAANLRTHKLALGFGILVVGDAEALHVDDTRFDYGERRVICYGRVGKRLYVAVYAERGDEMRIISVRKANEREQHKFRDHASG